MKRHEARHSKRTERPWTLKPKCSCGEEFRSLCDFWHHQAEEYERLMAHYTHLFEPLREEA